MSRPLVSIAIPTYNRAPMLRRALLSAQAQTYEPLEIVVSDNASTDDTVEMVREMARDDDRIRLSVNETNIVSLNFLKVIERSRGHYIKYLNDDDLLLPRAVERLVEPMEDPNVGLSFARQDWMDSDGFPLALEQVGNDQQWWSRKADLGRTQVLSGKELGDYSLVNTVNTFGCHSAHLFRRDDVPLARFGRLDGRRFCAPNDVAQALQLVAGRNVAYTHEPTVYIRVHEGQSSGLKRAELHLLSSLEWLDIVLSAPALGYLANPADRAAALGKLADLLTVLPQLEQPGDDAARIAHALNRLATALQDLNEEVCLAVEDQGDRFVAPIEWPVGSDVRRLLAHWTRSAPEREKLVLLVNEEMLALRSVRDRVEAALREQGTSLDLSRIGLETMPPVLT